jgi:hypothetical protein
MRAIAKRLAFAFTARAPVIGFATFHGNGIRAFLSNFRVHFSSP